MAQPIILSHNEGEKYASGPYAITARVLGAQCGNAFELYELAMGKGSVDYHIHRQHDETIFVLEGEVEFLVAGEKFVRSAGSVAFVPRGVHHGFNNNSNSRVRVLIQFTPNGNQHEFFRELETLFAAPTLDNARLAALQTKYDQELIPLPK